MFGVLLFVGFAGLALGLFCCCCFLCYLRFGLVLIVRLLDSVVVVFVCWFADEGVGYCVLVSCACLVLL